MLTPNHIFYVEFRARDLVATKAFFTAVFGWKFTDYGPDYADFQGAGVMGGLAREDKCSRLATGGALAVIFTREIEAMRDKVVQHGGRITDDIFAFPGGRRFHFTEPSGNELSVCALDEEAKT